ncbi:MAG TPA: pyridoxal phosphate-dependent aminotransferase [Gemmatimonadales bacterium]|nr:pyridoxal phosphate-dependent aminotransferase [Gemmatimonadales bacterium]
MSQAFRPARRLVGIEKSAIRQFFDRAPAGSINLGLGEPDLPTPDVIRQAAVRAIQGEQNGYTTHAGLPALRERVASEYPHMAAGVDRVIVTAGSQEALYLALTTLVDEGDEVLVPDPGFVAYPTIVRMAGGKPVSYRLPGARDFELDIDAFRRQISPRTKVVVCISPSNPTGRVLAPRDLEAMAAALRDSGAIVVSDEIYRDLYFGAARPGSISEYYPATVVVAGLSKSLSMTGWRLGWLVGPADIVKSALVLHGYVTTCASAVSQKAALAAWTPEAETAREGMRRTFRERRDSLLSLLGGTLGLKAVPPDGAFYTMVNVAIYGSSLAVAETLLGRGVITVPGGTFGAEGEGFLRLSFCAASAALEEGVRRMGQALAQLKPRQELPV